MRRDRFSMYLRNGIWYVQFYNQSTRKYLPARSTRESSRSAALLVIAEWLKNGVPEPRRGVRRLRSLHELLDLDTALATLSAFPLSSDDVQRIVGVLRDRELIRDATIGAGPGSEPLLSFLGRFWNYENSPYVLERMAHGQRISRHHCQRCSQPP